MDTIAVGSDVWVAIDEVYYEARLMDIVQLDSTPTFLPRYKVMLHGSGEILIVRCGQLITHDRFKSLA